jgi:hypothetical protein
VPRGGGRGRGALAEGGSSGSVVNAGAADDSGKSSIDAAPGSTATGEAFGLGRVAHRPPPAAIASSAAPSAIASGRREGAGGEDGGSEIGRDAGVDADAPVARTSASRPSSTERSAGESVAATSACEAAPPCSRAASSSAAPKARAVGQRSRGSRASAREDGVERRCGRAVRDERGDRHREDLVEAVGVVRAAEEALLREHLPRDHPEREDVEAPIEGCTLHVFGGEVAHLPLEDAFGGRAVVAREALGETEIGHLGVTAARDEHVLRRDVAVDEPERGARLVRELVDRVQPLGDVEQDPERDARRPPILDGRSCLIQSRTRSASVTPST